MRLKPRQAERLAAVKNVDVPFSLLVVSTPEGNATWLFSPNLGLLMAVSLGHDSHDLLPLPSRSMWCIIGP